MTDDACALIQTASCRNTRFRIERISSRSKYSVVVLLLSSPPVVAVVLSSILRATLGSFGRKDAEDVINRAAASSGDTLQHCIIEERASRNIMAYKSFNYVQWVRLGSSYTL